MGWSIVAFYLVFIYAWVNVWIKFALSNICQCSESCLLLKKSTSKMFHFCHSKGQKCHGHISVTKLWQNSVCHLCSVITVARWRFRVFRHGQRYIHDDFAPVTKLFQLAFQCTRVWWRGQLCVAVKSTRVPLWGWHVYVCLVDMWLSLVCLRGSSWAMTFFCHKKMTNFKNNHR
jgi:hypothetical protein